MAASDERTRTDLVRISGSGASAVMGRIDIVSEQPSGGTIQITENGVYDVTEYSEADVQVEGLVPTGTKNITTNGQHDVTEYATANVNVPASAVVSGTKQITANGTGIDVTDYASVDVNVIVPTYSKITFINSTSNKIYIWRPEKSSNNQITFLRGAVISVNGTAETSYAWVNPRLGNYQPSVFFIIQPYSGTVSYSFSSDIASSIKTAVVGSNTWVFVEGDPASGQNLHMTVTITNASSS